MGIDAELLAAAREAQTRLVDADRAADIARAEFRHAVRRLHLAGGSLREIAEVLALSHQRVHQIVEEAAGSRGWRSFTIRGPRKAGVPPKCSFCGKPQQQTGKLIAGTGVAICDQCVDLADHVIATGEPAATPRSAVKPIDAEATTLTCGFCGKSRAQVSALAACAAATICTECLLLCHEIITDPA